MFIPGKQVKVIQKEKKRQRARMLIKIGLKSSNLLALQSFQLQWMVATRSHFCGKPKGQIEVKMVFQFKIMKIKGFAKNRKVSTRVISR